MSDHLLLQDGRAWKGSTGLVTWVLELTSRELTGPIAHWLRDMSKRANGMATFDLRGLSEENRIAFCSATAQARTKAMQSGEYSDESGFVKWNDLLRMLRGEVPESDPLPGTFPFDGEAIDLYDLWFCPYCDSEDFLTSEKTCGKCGRRVAPN